MTLTHSFAGRTALITGAASGIGAACAQWLDQQGIGQLLLVDRDQQGLGALNLSCTTQHYCGDVADVAFWDDLSGKIGRIDHAIVNAGIAQGAPIAETDFADWRRLMAVNLDGAFLTLRAAMQAMDTGGSVVMLGSVAGIKPIAGAAAYGVSKAALIHLSKVAALEGAAQKIRVNALAPGGVDTAIWEGNADFDALVAQHGREKALATMASATPSGRFASAEEIARTIGFLLSDAADNITGAVLSSDGGFSL